MGPAQLVRTVAVVLVALALQLSGVAPVFAQAGDPANPGNFSANPHPGMTWAYYNPNLHGFEAGQVIRYIEVSAQQVVLNVDVPVPDGVPRRTEQQWQTIPGYYVTETTTGFLYPERWTIAQLNAGVYQWVRLPARFQRK
jgi:hypothetical protein